MKEEYQCCQCNKMFPKFTLYRVGLAFMCPRCFEKYKIVMPFTKVKKASEK